MKLVENYKKGGVELEERIKLVELILKMNDTQFATFMEQAKILLSEAKEQPVHPSCS